MLLRRISQEIKQILRGSYKEIGGKMLKRPKILVAGSFNMDLTASCTRAPRLGETVIGKKFRTAPGGKGFNQAVQCSRLGADVTMVGKVGADDFGKALLEAAKGEGIDISHVLVDSDEATSLPKITEVQELLRERGYEDIDLSLLDVLR